MISWNLLITLFLLVPLAAGQVNSATSPSGTPGKLQPFEIALTGSALERRTLENVTEVLTKSGISGGVVVLSQDCSHGPVRHVSIAEGSTLGRALDAIVSADGQSQWEVRDGIVNVLPLGPIPQFLQVSIRSFEWDKTASPWEAVGRLQQVAEVRQRIGELGLHEAPGEGGARALCIRDCDEQPKSQPIFQVEKDVTLLTLLNRIVRAHNGAIWSYSEYRCKGGTEFKLVIVAE